MKCPNCGKEIANDSKYCEYCGKKIKTSSRPLLIIIVLTVILLAMVILVSLLRQGSAPKAGTTWSYTERVVTEEGYDEVTSYFVFWKNHGVIWLMGTPQNNMFPLGFGEYDSSTGEIRLKFSYDYGIESDAIVFDVDMTKKTAVLKADHKWLKPFYNEGNTFSLTEEDYTLEPSEELVGSDWRGRYGNHSVAFSFKSWNEVAIEEDGDEELRAYVCFDDMVSIKAGDNLEYENLIGKYIGGNDMTLCRDGLDDISHSDECITLRRISDESDTEAFQACRTIDDYRTYIALFGKKALYYDVACDSIRLFVADSIAKEEKVRADRKAELIAQGYVDLGLPSGTFWKRENEDGGLYGYNKALARFGDNLPTEEQFRELIDSCQWVWLGLDKGYKVIGPSGEYVILPTQGHIAWESKYWPRSMGWYLSSTRRDADDHYTVSILEFLESRVYISGFTEYPKREKDVFRGSVRLVQNPYESSRPML